MPGSQGPYGGPASYLLPSQERSTQGGPGPHQLGQPTSTPAAPYQLQTVLNTDKQLQQAAHGISGYRPPYSQSAEQEYIPQGTSMSFGGPPPETIMQAGGAGPSAGVRGEGSGFPMVPYYPSPTTGGLPPNPAAITQSPAGAGFEMQNVGGPWSSGPGVLGPPGQPSSVGQRQDMSSMPLPPPGSLAAQGFSTSPPFGSNPPFASLMAPIDRPPHGSMRSPASQRGASSLSLPYPVSREGQPSVLTEEQPMRVAGWGGPELERPGTHGSMGPRSTSMAERGGSGAEDSPRSESGKKKRVVHGPWKEAEGNRLKELAAASKGRNPKLQPDEVDWDWVCEQFGNTRSRHQILIKAVYLGIKRESEGLAKAWGEPRIELNSEENPLSPSATTTHSSRLIRQKQFQGREEEVPGITPEKLERIKAEKAAEAAAEAASGSGPQSGETQTSPPYGLAPGESLSRGDRAEEGYRRYSQTDRSSRTTAAQPEYPMSMSAVGATRPPFGSLSSFGHDEPLPSLTSNGPYYPSFSSSQAGPSTGNRSGYTSFPPPSTGPQGQQAMDVFRNMSSNLRGASDDQR
jgi:hypothetical protein